MNTRLGCLVFALLAACGPPASDATTPDPLAGAEGDGVDGDGTLGARGAEIEGALVDERRRLAELDARIDAAEDDTVVELRHDRTARASFIAHLERCQAGQADCPPSLAEPAMDGADAAAIAAQACACRTRACAEWVYDAVEPFDADESATAAVTAARECAHDRIHGY